MFDILGFLEDSKTIYCVKDFPGRVLYQNKICIELCGVRTSDSEPCDKNCMTKYAREKECPEREKGTRYLPFQLVEDRFFDIFFINDGQTLVSILVPLEDRHQVDVQYFTQDRNFTAKEIEIASLMVKRMTNKDICLKLNLKINTLKKHIKNIYQKLPLEVAFKLRTEYR